MDRQCKKTTTTIYIWTDSAKKQQQQFTYGQTVQKKTTNNLHMDRQCKKTTNHLHMDRQCKKKTTNNLHMDRQCKKKQQTIYIWTDSAKKQQTIYIWTDSAKKLHWSIYSAPDSAKKQQQFTYGQYIFTDCTESQCVSNKWILYKVTCGGRAGASPEWTVSTAPGVCVCPLLQVCVSLSTAPGVCVCVCPLLQVCVCVSTAPCVCVCVCVSTAPGVFALGWVKYREHISLLIIHCIICDKKNKKNMLKYWAKYR